MTPKHEGNYKEIESFVTMFPHFSIRATWFPHREKRQAILEFFAYREFPLLPVDKIVLLKPITGTEIQGMEISNNLINTTPPPFLQLIEPQHHSESELPTSAL